MKEKLTRERLQNAMFWSSAGMDELWKHIESDREAIREETREEMRKDHFRIGERSEVQESKGGPWVEAVIGASRLVEPQRMWSTTVSTVRRPPKMRPMKREEKIDRLYNLKRPITSFGRSYLEKLTDKTIDELCIVDCIPTEVPTE